MRNWLYRWARRAAVLKVFAVTGWDEYHEPVVNRVTVETFPWWSRLIQTYTYPKWPVVKSIRIGE